MNYTLIGSLRSPFVRMVRLLLINNHIDFNFQVINFLDNPEDAEYLARTNPVNKVPILLEDAQKIFDSRVIFNHLTQKHKLRQLTIEEENTLTIIHSCMDVSVNLLLLKMGGLDMDTPNWFIKRQRARIPTALHSILPWVQSLDENKLQIGIMYPWRSIVTWTGPSFESYWISASFPT